jgi:hypothetical protein
MDEQYSQENPLNQLRLVRNKSNQGGFQNSGYLFLAIVFCMMCCSSLFYSTSDAMKATLNSAILNSQFKPINFESIQRQLKSTERQQNQNTNSFNLNSPITDGDGDTLMKEEEESQVAQTGQHSLMQMMLSGKYTYITYILMSTTCFFFWLSPNCHKFRSIFAAKSMGGMVGKRSSTGRMGV